MAENNKKKRKRTLRGPRSPKETKVFKKNWIKLIGLIINRDNFHDCHLDHLEVLCDLYQDYQDLSEKIRENGWCVESEGRHGTQKKLNPEVSQRNHVVQEIRHYSKILKLEISDVAKEVSEGNSWE